MSYRDVVIVGGGVGGCALAANLATAGLKVLVLERENVFVDRVRGEWITPWGTQECQRLGLHQVLIDAGANEVARFIPYDEFIPPTLAEAATVNYSESFPTLPLPLCMEHVLMQNALLSHARACVWRTYTAWRNERSGKRRPVAPRVLVRPGRRIGGLGSTHCRSRRSDLNGSQATRSNAERGRGRSSYVGSFDR